MILEILQYGDPILRVKGERIERIDERIRELARNMIETMHEAHGVGLAAQQIGEALQLTVIDVRPAKDRPSTLELHGQPADVAAIMLLVLINPQITPYGEPVSAPEGCLSFPEIYGDITRPESVSVIATNAKGERFEFKAGGLLARAVQHEYDHLQGILFIDRMSAKVKSELQSQLEILQAATKAALK